MTSTPWNCSACGARHTFENTNPSDVFRIAGARYCCIATFAKAANSPSRTNKPRQITISPRLV